MNWKGELYKLLDGDIIYDFIDLFLQDNWSQRIPLILIIGLKLYCILQKNRQLTNKPIYKYKFYVIMSRNITNTRRNKRMKTLKKICTTNYNAMEERTKALNKSLDDNYLEKYEIAEIIKTYIEDMRNEINNVCKNLRDKVEDAIDNINEALDDLEYKIENDFDGIFVFDEVEEANRMLEENYSHVGEEDLTDATTEVSYEVNEKFTRLCEENKEKVDIFLKKLKRVTLDNLSKIAQ